MSAGAYDYLASDHERLDRLLQRATKTPGAFDTLAYDDFRKGLLRHIAVEERILLPELARLQGVAQIEAARRLRLDHGALVALLVPPPTDRIIAAIRSILVAHNALEEGPDGVYHRLDQLAGSEHSDIIDRMKKTPDVPVLPFNDRPDPLASSARALARAGYDFPL